MIGTVIVGYQNEALTATYVRQELSKLKVDNLIVVVDNSPTTAGSRYLESQLGACVVDAAFSGFEPGFRVYVITTGENLGFARANNLGVDFIRTCFPEIEYVLFSNNDIQIVDPQVVDTLIAKYQSVKGIGMIGPNVLYVDGKRQTPMPKTYLWRNVCDTIWSPLMALFKKSSADYCDSAQEGFHYTLAECFFISRIDDYVACGMMDPHTFLYAEGCILSERMKQIGLGYYFVPDVTVIHACGATTSQHVSASIYMMIVRSYAYYYKAYRGYSAFSVGCYLALARVMTLLSKLKRLMA